MRTTEVITAVGIDTTDNELIIRLSDREVRIRWQRCSALLAAATPEERRLAELSPGGYGIHWPLLDEDLSVGGLVRWKNSRRPQRRRSMALGSALRTPTSYSVLDSPAPLAHSGHRLRRQRSPPAATPPGLSGSVRQVGRLNGTPLPPRPHPACPGW